MARGHPWGVILWQTGLFCGKVPSVCFCRSILGCSLCSPEDSPISCQGLAWLPQFWEQVEEERGAQGTQSGCRLSCSLMLFTCYLLPLLTSLHHIPHFISKLPSLWVLLIASISLLLVSLRAGSSGSSSFPHLLSNLFQNKHLCARLCGDPALHHRGKLNSMTA